MKPPAVFRRQLHGRFVRGVGLAGVGAVVLACGERAERPSTTTTVIDSAGVRIVSSSAPLLPGSITVAPQPSVVIGSLDGPAEDNLNRVRAATVLPDGRIVLLNSGAAEVQIRAPEGGHLVTIGREGEGPGEFRSPEWVTVAGEDTIAVYDPYQSNGRLTLYTSAGELLRSERPTVEAVEQPSPDGLLADGSFLDVRSEGSEDWTQVGHITYTSHALRYPRVGNRVDTLASAPGGEVFREQQGIGITGWLMPFAREERSAHGGDRVYLGNGVHPVIPGQPIGAGTPVSIRWEVEGRPVDSGLLDRWVDLQLDRPFFESNPGRAREYRERYATMPLPDLLPVHGELRVDAEERLWVQRYALPWERSNDWWVFDAEGRWLDTVTLPPGLRVLEIGDAYVLGVRTDSLDVEYVELYPLTDAPGG